MVTAEMNKFNTLRPRQNGGCFADAIYKLFNKWQAII